MNVDCILPHYGAGGSSSELLQMAKIDAAEIRLRRERVSVLTLIEDVLARYDDPAEPAYLLTDSHIGYRFAEAGPVYGSAGLVADQCE
jgi:hypothetical protein